MTNDAASGAWAAHDEACARGEVSYRDPETGYRVFTRLGLQKREKCCGCGCRHCPFEHDRVADKAAYIQQPALLHATSRPRTGPRSVVFWSSGKDSLLALRAWLRSGRAPGDVVLLTTFGVETRTVAHQEVAIEEVVRQARHLDLDLVGVPLHAGAPYLDRLRAGLEAVGSGDDAATTLVFGDLHLEHVRAWREDALASLGIPRAYPLWQVEYSILLEDLARSGVPCHISACPGRPGAPGSDAVRVGARFDADLARAAAAAGWDAFGEDGEFHTLARVWEVAPEQAMGLE